MYKPVFLPNLKYVKHDLEDREKKRKTAICNRLPTYVTEST